MRPKVSEAITAIYGCAMQPADWPRTLQCIADCFDDVGGILIHKRQDAALGVLASRLIQPAVQAYQSHWPTGDIGGLRAFDYGYGSHDGAVPNRHNGAGLEPHPVHTESLASFGLGWVASVYLSPQAGVDVALGVMRSLGKPPYSDDDLKVLMDLGHHVERALRLSLRLIDAESVGLGLGEALNRIAIGTFVVDSAGRLLFSNHKAADLLKSVFVVRDGLLICRNQVSQARFFAMLRKANAPTDTLECLKSADNAPLVIKLDDEGGRLAVSVSSLQTTGESLEVSWLADAKTLVLAVDVAPIGPIDPALVRDVFGLTLGESRVASLVGVGMSPHDAATRLDIAESTVRSALKRVFWKLGVSRQSELANLLSTLKMAGART